jgi:hypothetical protein
MLVVIRIACGQGPGDPPVVDSRIPVHGLGLDELAVRGTNDVASR